MDNDTHIILDKELRRDIDVIIQRLKRESDPDFTGMRPPDHPIRQSEERKDAVKSLKLAVILLGMDLKAINEEHPGSVENPYPNSKP